MRVVRVFTFVPEARSSHLPQTLREAFPHLVSGQEFERGTQGVTDSKAHKAAGQAISATNQTRKC